MKQQIMEEIRQHKIISILRGIEDADIIKTVQALYDGGIRLVEVTFNQKSVTCIRDTVWAINKMVEVFGDRICVGAGTVMTVTQVREAVRAGAKYLISPHTDAEVIKATVELGRVSVPGALTSTEIVLAYNSGADFVKVFPADSLGFDYIKAVTAPLNHIPLLAVGGVDEKNLLAFISSGFVGVGVGSGLVKPSLVKEGRFDLITQQARAYTSQICGSSPLPQS